MIYIEQDSLIAEQNNLRVASPSGEYEDTALVAFYDVARPHIELGSYQAQYVKYGSMIYKFNDPKELGEEILKVDPESKHEAAVFVRMSNELLAQMNGGTITDTSLAEIRAQEGLPDVGEVAGVGTAATDTATSTTTPTTTKPTRKPKKPKTKEPVAVVSDAPAVTTVEEATSIIEAVNTKADEISEKAKEISKVIDTVSDVLK